MGIESRDWFREESRRGRTVGPSRRALVLGAVVALLAVLVLSPTVRERLGYTLPFGLEEWFGRDFTPGVLRVTIGDQPLYARDDPWRAWLADEAACPGGENAKASPAAQRQTMLCLVNHARRHQGVPPVSLSPVLAEAAAAKAQDIVRCGVFEHEACGKAVDQGARDLGYAGSLGENLYVAEGAFVVPRVALDRWLNSGGHRENLFRPEWKTVGIALLSGADVERVRDGVVWVNQFGD